MRRAGFVVLAMVMLGGILASGSGTAAQDATPQPEGDHPIIGAWLFDNAANDPDSPYTLDFFYAEGTHLTIDGYGNLAGGVWEATGPDTADLTIWFLEGQALQIVRAAFTVSEDGQSLSASYTIERIEPDGTSTGQAGPKEVEATRLAVEPQGVPVGSYEEVFGTPPVPDATPAE